MHYTGMAAMELNGDISYSVTRVGLSVGIAVVAATVALWLAMTVQKPLVIFFSALVMGVAVNGMHFTGMSAMSVMEHDPTGNLSGASATGMLVPIGLGVVFALIGLVYALMAAPSEEDRAADRFGSEWERIIAYRTHAPSPGTAAIRSGFGPVTAE